MADAMQMRELPPKEDLKALSSSVVNKAHKALESAPDNVKQFYSNLCNLKGLNTDKNLHKRQLISKIAEANFTFDSPWFDALRTMYNKEEEGTHFEWISLAKLKHEEGEEEALLMIKLKQVLKI